MNQKDYSTNALKSISNQDLIQAFQRADRLSKRINLQDLKGNPFKFFYLDKNPYNFMHTTTLWILSQILKKSFKLKTKTFWGDKINVVIPEMVSLRIHCYGFFEPDLTCMIIEYLKPGMTFFDIGAHFGLFTLLASHIVGSSGFVHAFEPVPSTFKILMSNTLSKENIRILPHAVFSDEKTITMKDYGIKYSSFNSIYAARLPDDVKAKREYHTQAITVDNYVRDSNSHPDFIKIDAESAEYDILLGMKKTLSSIRPIVTLEVGDYIEGHIESTALISYLMGFDYKPFEWRENQLVRHKVRNHYQFENLLFLPNKKQ